MVNVFMANKVNVFWFRRDLRIHDNKGFYKALKSGNKVLPIFIFDRNILDELPTVDARVHFIHDTMAGIREEFSEVGSDVHFFYDSPKSAFEKLLNEYEIDTVYANRDYEPYAKKRDKTIKELLAENEIAFELSKDHVLLERDEVLKDDGDPYTVFTPYSKKWLKTATEEDFESVESEKLLESLLSIELNNMPSLKDMGFKESEVDIPSRKVADKTLEEYHEKRNFPAEKGTSRLGVHLRFGTISIRALARRARELNEAYLNELIWRDFYAMILHHYPHVNGEAFRKKYDNIPWRDSQEDFEKWCAGKTGYPIVDAGMRELNETGYMHNRVRMIVASFLTKHLLIDWRWGESYFAEKLLDYELASNNGGWQWAAGSGCDAAPYFRIFNPESQTKKFDKDLKYIKKWVPELDTDDYPEPMVNHKEARQRALDTYKEAIN